jgi:DNA repair exonuclease SbcCD ATPase subunit
LTAELQRLTAELQRLTAELQRLTAELQRLTAERQRLTVERQRLAAEEQRPADIRTARACDPTQQLKVVLSARREIRRGGAQKSVAIASTGSLSALPPAVAMQSQRHLQLSLPQHPRDPPHPRPELPS